MPFYLANKSPGGSDHITTKTDPPRSAGCYHFSQIANTLMSAPNLNVTPILLPYLSPLLTKS